MENVANKSEAGEIEVPRGRPFDPAGAFGAEADKRRAGKTLGACAPGFNPSRFQGGSNV
jgi:hypothetical protein